MKAFAELLDRLYFTYSHLEKKALLKNFFAKTPDPERGYAIAIIAGALHFKYLKRKLIYDLALEKIDQVLFNLSYDYVGDLSDTIALIWPHDNKVRDFPSLSEIILTLGKLNKEDTKTYLRDLFNRANKNERWALIKMAAEDLRIGVSARFLKQTLAEYGAKEIQEIEEMWHALSPPYENLFAWLENRTAKPNIIDKVFFHPVMLSQPLNEKDLVKIDLSHFAAEWKYDGIRVQIVSTVNGKCLFSRSGDNITQSFPDILEYLNFYAVLDGELVVKHNGEVGLFNDLQQRLNRKKPNPILLKNYPAHVILYDAIILDHADIRSRPFIERRHLLEKWFKKISNNIFSLSPLLSFKTTDELKYLRIDLKQHPNSAVEGVMLKRKESLYIPGRPAGQWYKWKRDPLVIDAVLMYAQRGQGIRSSFYSDYTFGLWQNEKILPIGKAYFGFTDEELIQLDKWVRRHTIQKFGPVREVEKNLVFEIAFDAIQLSTRHKSGYALRFPRINRIRWDKPAQEADTIEQLKALYLNQSAVSKSKIK